MRFIFVSLPTFEPWSWTNPDVEGIGGSEVSHIEMARRLSRRGNEVHSYAPVPFEGTVENEEVLWTHAKNTDFNLDGIWVVYRAPEVIDHIPEGQIIWHVFQDVDYPRMTVERANRCTRLVALCEEHARYLRKQYPDNAHKVCVTSNGIKRERIEEILKNGPPERNPRRIMYASSPDRGMKYLIPIFAKAREVLSDLELHVYYGFNNIDKATEVNPRIKPLTDELKSLLTVPGVVNHSRMGQPMLLRQWMMAGIWCHPSYFTETSCITCMDAQACGAVPLTTPTWAIAENVKHGVFIHGNPEVDQ